MNIAFRLTIYQTDGVTPELFNGEPYITSIRGDDNPYIVNAPNGDGQEVDLLTGGVRSGAYVVEVADVVTGSTATGTVRLITNKLEDNNYRQQLLSRRAKLECTRDGGSSWSIWMFGYLTNIRQTDAITYALTVSDSRRVESTHTAFTWSTVSERLEFPNRGCILGGPVIENFGPLRASGGWEFLWREVQSGYLALAFQAAYDPPSYARNPYPTFGRFMYDARNFLERLPPIASLTGANYEQLRNREYVFAYPKLVAMVVGSTGTWYGSVRGAFTPAFYSSSGAGDRNLGPDISRQNFVYVELDPGQSVSYPPTNERVRVRILEREVSEINPLYINEHPVDIVAKLYSTVSIPYSTSSLNNTKQAIGDDVTLALRITEPVNMSEFLSESLFGPFGFSARTNSNGQQEFFPTRIARSIAPSVTIGANDIVGDTPPVVFDVDEATLVTSFKLTSKALVPFVPDPDNKVDPPADGMVQVEASLLRQNVGNTTLATREVAYTFPGMVHDGSATVLTTAFVLSPDVVTKFFDGIVEEGFDRFGRGAIVSEVQVLANSAAANLQIGDEVIIDIPYYPNKNYRIGESNVGTRIAQIVRRTEMPEGPIFKMVDSGVDQQPAMPTFTVGAWSGDPRRIATVTVDNATTLNSAQVTLAVQYQVSPTSPTKTGTVYTRFRPGTIPTSAFLLPIAPPGSRVWVRMRTEKAELRASLWTNWEDVTLGSWVAPTGLTASVATANSMTLTWSLNGNTLDPMDIFAYPGASAPADWTAYRIGTSSAGSITQIVRDLLPSTQYTFGVAFKDTTTGAYSGITTTTATTAAINTTSCPAPPRMKVITSFENAGATTGVVLSIGAIEGYNVVIQRAPNVSGSPGTFEDIAVLLPLTGYFADILPSDNVTRWYRVFYRLSGFLDGAPGPSRSASPIAIPDDLILSEGPSIISGGSSLTFGTYLTGTPDSFYDGTSAQTVAVDATSNSVNNKVVARDAVGNFSANVVTATLNGSAPAGSLTGTTLAANVTASSLTSVGTIATGTWQGSSVAKNYGGTGFNAATFSGIINERVMAYDGVGGSFFIAPSGSNGQALMYIGGALAWGNPAPGPHVLATTTALGPDHTVSGLTAGMILQATGATTARFQTPSIPASSVTAGTFSGTSYTITNDLTVSGTLTASLPFSSITSKPTTLSGYGITDGVSTGGSYANPSWITSLAWSKITGTPTTIAGYGITDAVSTSGSYANPSWITSLAGSKITGNISGSAANVTGIVAIANGGTNKTSYTVSGTGTRVLVYDPSTGAFDVVSAGTSGQFLRSSGTTGDVFWATPPNFTTSTAGYAPASGGGTSNFLRADGTWAVPSVGSVSANNVTAGTFSGANYFFTNNVRFDSGARVAFGNGYTIDNAGGSPVSVLTATTLGSGVVNSSLTSVGTLTSGAIGAGFTAIANSALANSAITINGSSVSLGGSITVSSSQWTTVASGIYYNSGNVAIGSTAGSYTLDVFGSFACRASSYVYDTTLYAYNSSVGKYLGFTTDANGGVLWMTDGTSPLRLQLYGGNVGIGVANPTQQLHITGYARMFGYIIDETGGTRSAFVGYEKAWIGGGSSNDLAIAAETGNDIKFYTNGSATLKMELTTLGRLLINDSGWASSRLQVNESSGPTAEFNGTGNSAGLPPVYIWNNAEAGNTYFQAFYTDGQLNPRALRGYIFYRRNTNEMVLSSISDYRAKTIHGPYTKSGEVFDKIQIHDGTMHEATMGHIPMAVAHELAEAVPYAVDGEKDAVNEDGTPKLQMVTYTSLIPLMLAEIKSLRARVAEMETKLQ